ncbi:MAG: hypothetical protein MUO62_08200, partial [Anaerolineales bacterium]|nr:hypothetical protein [Anaerolineales bacterium]
INIFFRAAAPFTQDPWEWVVRAGMESLATPSSNRQKTYAGPRFEDLPNLSQTHKNAMLALL